MNKLWSSFATGMFFFVFLCQMHKPTEQSVCTEVWIPQILKNWMCYSNFTSHTCSSFLNSQWLRHLLWLLRKTQVETKNLFEEIHVNIITRCMLLSIISPNLSFSYNRHIHPWSTFGSWFWFGQCDMNRGLKYSCMVGLWFCVLITHHEKNIFQVAAALEQESRIKHGTDLNLIFILETGTEC